MLLAANTTAAHIPTPEEDTLIVNGIKKHIAKSVTLSRFNIDVTSDKGIVTLKGNVNANSQASALIELAQSIIGVRDVQSQLTVERSQQVLSDTITTAKVRGLFLREGLLGPKRGVAFMSVETRNGIVYLTGTIMNKDKIDRAKHLIEGLSGVKGVEYKFQKFVPNT
jgi:hyperosmotically inducible protein